MSWLFKLTQDTQKSRSRAFATTVVLFCLPLISWLGLILLGLVTLMQGFREGAYLVVLLLLCQIVFYAVQGHELILFYNCATVGLMWLAAAGLAATHSWDKVLQIMSLSLALCILIIHLAVGSLDSWWLSRLLPLLERMVDSNADAVTALREQLPVLVRVATGLQASWLFMGILWKLMCARTLQAMLYHKRVLLAELAALRLPNGLLVVAALCAAGVWLNRQEVIVLPQALDILPVLLLPMALIGLSLFYSLFLRKRFLLSLVFVLLTVLFFVQVCIMLVVLSVLDRWFNLRKRWQLIVKG